MLAVTYARLCAASNFVVGTIQIPHDIFVDKLIKANGAMCSSQLNLFHLKLKTDSV